MASSSSRNSDSRALWNDSSFSDFNEEEDDAAERKPELSRISKISHLIESHSIHDYSIHKYKLKKYSVSSSEVDGSLSKGMSRQKCGDSYVAQTCCGTKQWTTEDVARVISIERKFFRTNTMVVRFPDKKITKQAVRNLHQNICAVHFTQTPFARRCCITLKDSANRNAVLTYLNSTRWGTGFISADGNFEELMPSADDIDPFTLLLDHIPQQMTKQELIEMFPNCQQIVVGYTNKIYYTKRFAFIIYLTIKDALDAFNTKNNESDVLLRFRRFSSSAQLPMGSEIKQCQSKMQSSSPIISDPGLPVVLTERHYNVLETISIKSEPNNRGSESLDDDVETIDDDDDDEEDHTATTSEYEELYQKLKRSRMQMRLLSNQLT